VPVDKETVMSQGEKYDPTRTYMLTRVAQPEPRNRFVGVLRPAKGILPAEQPISIPAEVSEFAIGRQGDLAVTLEDDWVSRKHARIRRTGDEFVLEDLGSSNGTYVDGVPIVSCVLRVGDWIQIGRNLFRFEVHLDSASGGGDMTTWLE
jgi:pSer/pThr/pTyr-binding forkhead associated (FHA) protein